MNTNEGLIRIAKATRVVGYFFAAVFVLIGVAIIVTNPSEMMVGVLMALPAGICAAIGWGLGWIVEGFAKPKA